MSHGNGLAEIIAKPDVEERVQTKGFGIENYVISMISDSGTPNDVMCDRLRNLRSRTQRMGSRILLLQPKPYLQ